jgi:hypothetical protein
MSFTTDVPAGSPVFLKLQRVGGGQFFIDDLVVTPGPALPVKLSSVKAVQKGAGIQVEWNNQTETNVSRYEVERSANGVQFANAATLLPSSNRGAASYTWFDYSPLNGNNFYRVKVLGKGGEIEYSQVMKVAIGKSGGAISIYPNPLKGNILNVQLTNIEQGNYTMRVYNAQGQQVFSKQIDHAGGSTTQALDIGQKTSSGIYVLKIFSGDKVIEQETFMRE